MQTARKDGGEEVAAVEFARLSDMARRSYQGRFTCPYLPCSAPAFFRKRSVDGRPPLFYSNAHDDDCVERSRERHSQTVGDVEEEPAVWNSANELEMRYDDPAESAKTVPGETPEGRSRRGRRRSSDVDDRFIHSTSIGLRPLLRRLRDGAAAIDWRTPLTLGDGTRGTLESLVHRGSPDIPLGKRIIVWGKIELARGEWINLGLKGYRMPAVRVPESVRAGVLQQAGADTLWDLTGSWVAIEGEFRLTSEDSPYRTLDDARFIAVLPAAPGGEQE